jgi:hypothetical protein
MERVGANFVSIRDTEGCIRGASEYFRQDSEKANIESVPWSFDCEVRVHKASGQTSLRAECIFGRFGQSHSA